MTEIVKGSAFRAIAAALVALVGFGSTSCSKPARIECQPSSLIDTAGVSSEKQRVDFQWLVIKVGMDSALRSSAGIASHRASESGLDTAISHYRDSMKLEGTGVVSKSGCLDWATTWTAGRFDHGAMITAFLRTLGKDSVSAIEWSTVSDSASSDLKLRTIYSLPGADGGRIDSAVLRLEHTMVSIAPR